MGLLQLGNIHFNPWEETKQVKDNTPQSFILGGMGLVAMGTAAIAHFFFKGHSFGNPKTVGVMGAAGELLFTSYLTEKDGYAWLVGALATAGVTYATIDATINGRFFVNVNFDLAAIIREARETYQFMTNSQS